MTDVCIFCNLIHNKEEICGDYRCNEQLTKYLSNYLNLNTKNLMDEINIITRKKLFKCLDCERFFGSKLGLDYHIKKAVCKKEKDKTFVCEKCNKIFTEKKNLQYHQANAVCEKNTALTVTNISNTSNTTNNTSNNTSNNTTNNQQNIQTQNINNSKI